MNKFRLDVLRNFIILAKPLYKKNQLCVILILLSHNYCCSHELLALRVCVLEGCVRSGLQLQLGAIGVLQTHHTRLKLQKQGSQGALVESCSVTQCEYTDLYGLARPVDSHTPYDRRLRPGLTPPTAGGGGCTVAPLSFAPLHPQCSPLGSVVAK